MVFDWGQCTEVLGVYVMSLTVSLPLPCRHFTFWIFLQNLQLFAYPPTTVAPPAPAAPPPPLLPPYYYYPPAPPMMYSNPAYTQSAATTTAATATAYPDYPTYVPYTINPYSGKLFFQVLKFSGCAKSWRDRKGKARERERPRVKTGNGT